MTNSFQETGSVISLRTTATVLTAAWLMVTSSGCASSLLNLTGANAFGEKFASLMDRDKDELADKDDNNDFETRVNTPLLRDYVSVTGNNVIALRGVGLVTGLPGTGGDPPPSHLRTELLEEMKTRKIPNPSRLLKDRNTALVMVTAYLPAMCRKGQKFDVRVQLPPNSEATSLKGGWLLETRLAEERSVQGRGNIKGHMYAVAHGAILTALGADGASKVSMAMLRRGSVPGGAVSNTERNLEIILRNEYRGLKTSKRVESAISGRLHHYNRFGQRIPMAEAKTDMMLELKVHPLYRNNFPRYQQMIRSIAFREQDIARRMRMEKLSKELVDPKLAGRAALQFEAIGSEAIPFLKSALTNEDPEVRFHSAVALAYLEDSSGVEVLKQAAMTEAAFRVYALAALSVIKDADGIVALRELMSAEELETRYGAVRALKENSPHDPSLGTREFTKQFVLHGVTSTSDPAVHVVRYRSPEIVVFGTAQELRLPATLNAGDRIMVKGTAGAHKVSITKYEVDADSKRTVSSTNLIEIIETLASLGATYPDIVQFLLEAETQSNLMGELGIDRLPQAGRVFHRNFGGQQAKPAKIGAPSLTPGLFERVEDSDSETSEEEATALSKMFAAKEQEPDGDSVSADTAVENTDASEGELNVEGLENMEEPFEFEETEFQEPMGSKVKRMFSFPFKQ